jgi:hypothetical protein
MIKKQIKHDTITDSIHLLLRAHMANEGMRLPQIIANAAMMGGWEQKDLFHCPDEVLLNGLENLLDDFKQLDNYEA